MRQQKLYHGSFFRLFLVHQSLFSEEKLFELEPHCFFLRSFTILLLFYLLAAAKLLIGTDTSVAFLSTELVSRTFIQFGDNKVEINRSSYVLFNPLTPRRTQLCPLSQKFQFYFKKGSSKRLHMSR